MWNDWGSYGSDICSLKTNIQQWNPNKKSLCNLLNMAIIWFCLGVNTEALCAWWRPVSLHLPAKSAEKKTERQTSAHTSVRTRGVILSPFYIILLYSVYYPIILSESKEQGQDTQPFLWWSCRILPFSPRLADLVTNKIHSHILWFQNVCFLYPAW